MVNKKEQFGDFQADINYRKSKKQYGQFPTPLNLVKAINTMVCGVDNNDNDITNKIIGDPCVGTGNFFIPLIGRGAILIGNDIDKEALVICKERVPEAILTNCDAFLCHDPQQTIKIGYQRIEVLENELSELNQKEKTDRKEKNRIKKIPLEIKGWQENVEKAKKIKSWKFGLYCLEHIFHEPWETEKKLWIKVQQDELKELRKNNNNEPLYFNCVRCKEKTIDEEIGCSLDEKEFPLCKSCSLKELEKAKELLNKDKGETR